MLAVKFVVSISLVLSIGFSTAADGAASCPTWEDSKSSDLVDPLPFAIDGWEKHPAPLLDRWQLLAPLASLEEVERSISPGALAEMFPGVGSTTLGRSWHALDSHGRGVAMGAQPLAPHEWALALVFINCAEPRSVRGNVSCHDVGALQLFLDGTRLLEIGTAKAVPTASSKPLRREGVDLRLPRGWSRLLVAMRGAGRCPTLYLQLTGDDAAGKDGAAPPLISTARLTPSQRQNFHEPAALGGISWVLERKRARGIFNDAYSDVWRAVARMNQGLPETEQGVAARARVSLLFDIGRLVARGGMPEALEVDLADARRRLAALTRFAADRGDAALRVSETLRSMEPWFIAPKKGLSSWHFLEGADDREDLWKRFHEGRKLFTDLLEYGRQVIVEAR